MTAQHTQGRLRPVSHNTSRLQGENGIWVADAFSSMRGQPNSEANARRLAACWNACEGMPTYQVEALHGFGGLGLLESKQVQMAFDERDKAREMAGVFMAERDRLRTELDEARALLAKRFDIPAGNPVETVRYVGETLVTIARVMGVVVTLSQRPLLPLAMRNYETVVDVRPARGCA